MTELITIITAVLFLVHASGKLVKAPLAVATGQTFGYASIILPLGIIEVALSIVLIVVVTGYLPSAVALGAILWFIISMGAATSHHILRQGFRNGWRAALIPAVFTLIGVGTIVVWL